MNLPLLKLKAFYPGVLGVPQSDQPLGIRTMTQAKVFYVDKGHALASDDNDGTDPENPLETIQEAIDKCTDDVGDVVMVMPGVYNESLLVNKSAITIVGAGGRYSTVVLPLTDGAEGMIVAEDGVSLKNMVIGAHANGDYALLVSAATDNFHAEDCMFYASDARCVEVIGSDNIVFDRCEFADSAVGIDFVLNVAVLSDRVIVKDSLFHNITTDHILTTGGVTNLQLIGNVHDVDDAGVEPTDYLDIAAAGTTGIVTGCAFATAANTAANLTIDADVFWVANMTEAGVSAARPA